MANPSFEFLRPNLDFSYPPFRFFPHADSSTFRFYSDVSHFSLPSLLPHCPFHSVFNTADNDLYTLNQLMTLPCLNPTSFPSY